MATLSYFFHIHLGKPKPAMEKKLTCILLELREDLCACWQVTRQKTQRVAHLAQRVAPLWCVAPEQNYTEKIALMRSAPWVRSAPLLMRSAPLELPDLLRNL